MPTSSQIFFAALVTKRSSVSSSAIDIPFRLCPRTPSMWFKLIHVPTTSSITYRHRQTPPNSDCVSWPSRYVLCITVHGTSYHTFDNRNAAVYEMLHNSMRRGHTVQHNIGPF